MKKYLRKSTYFFTIFYLLVFSSCLEAQIAFVSGIRKGSYHEFAKDIVNVSDMRIKLRNSYGSVDNLNQLIANTKPFVTFMQYDVLIDQKIREQEEGNSKYKSIKILTPLADEEIHLIARNSSDIRRLKHLRDRKVAIGSKKQGTQVTARLIQNISGVQWIEVEMGFEDALEALLKGDIEALFFVGYAPADKLSKYEEDINLKLVNIKSRKLKKVYSKSVIPEYTYKWQDKRTKTYAVKSVLATNISETIPGEKEKVYKFLRTIRDNYSDLVSDGHRKWKNVDFNYEDIDWEVYDGAKEILSQPEK